ncbi:MAG: hypothetical protein JXR07_18550 [Reichenbachiella sp.]
MKIFVLISLVIAGCSSEPKEPESAMDFLERSIAYHDPNGYWQDAEMKLIFTEIDATRLDLVREVSISNLKSTFHYHQKDEEKELNYSLEKDSCRLLLNGSPEFSDEDRKDYRLTCERAELLKNYYTYLYGLPMKLKDPGTIVHPEVVEEEFEGEVYNSIRVTYEEGVGGDTWYFYLDKDTYALRGYRFQHSLEEHDGEYITLDSLVEYKGLRIPKTRSWYVNKTGAYLATDELESIEEI